MKYKFTQILKSFLNEDEISEIISLHILRQIFTDSDYSEEFEKWIDQNDNRMMMNYDDNSTELNSEFIENAYRKINN